MQPAHWECINRVCDHLDNQPDTPVEILANAQASWATVELRIRAGS